MSPTDHGTTHRPGPARAAFGETLGDAGAWSLAPPATAGIEQWTAAYYLDLVSQEQYTQKWKDVVLWGTYYGCIPWYNVGRRMELEGRIDDAIAAYEKAIELGRRPDAHFTANYAAYRLRALTAEPSAGGVASSDDVAAD